MYRSQADRCAVFTAGFLSTLLESSYDQDDRPLGQDYSTADLAPAVRAGLESQCERFIQDNLDDLLFATEGHDYDWSQAGSDFALSRNSHGAGFFDRNLDERGDRLHEAAERAGAADVYVGDDGLIYVSGLETYQAPSSASAPRRSTP